MKNKKFIFIIGESTGLECLKEILKLKIIEISHVISSNTKNSLILKKLCKKNNILLYSFEDYKNNKIKYKNIKTYKYILISIFSELIIKNNTLKMFKKNCYNFHPGLLPFYPGKNCVAGVIYNNEKRAGVTLHLMDQKIDEGKIINKKAININYKNETLISLMLKLRIITIKMVKEFVLDIYKNKKIKMYKNDINKKKYFPKYIPNNGLINSSTAFKIFERMFRASNSGPFINPWGKIFFKYKNKKKNIFQYKILDKKKIKFNKKIFKIDKSFFIIKLKDKIIKIKA